MPTSGDIREITCNHPVLGNFRFLVKANEDSTFNLGGYRAEDDASLVDGGGNRIKKLNGTCWSVESTISIDLNGTTLEDINLLSEHPEDGVWTFSHIGGSVWGGTGGPVGENAANTNQGTMTLKVMGSNKLEKITSPV